MSHMNFSAFEKYTSLTSKKADPHVVTHQRLVISVSSTHTKYTEIHHLTNAMVLLPGHQGVPPSQRGRVELKNGRDVIPIRNRHEGVHDFVLDVPQPGSEGFLLQIHLKSKTRILKCT